MIGGFDEHSGHQVGVSLQVVNALFGGSAVNLDTVSRGAQQQPVMFHRKENLHFAEGKLIEWCVRNKVKKQAREREKKTLTARSLLLWLTQLAVELANGS